MLKRFRHPELGEYRQLNLTGVTVMVCDAEIRGLVRYLNDAQNHEADRAVLELLEQMLGLDRMDRPLWGETKEESQVATMVTKAGRTVPNPALRKIAPEKYKQELA